MKKVLIFDLDGTIVDSLGSIADCANDCIAEKGLPRQSTEDYRYFVGDGQYELIKRALRAAGDVELKFYDEVMANYIERFRERCHVGCKSYDGMPETLRWLKMQGMKLTVLSNKAHANTLKVVEEVFGPELFDYVQGQMENVARKPDPAGVYMIMERFGVSAKDCVYVGDTSVDMQTGKAAGIYTIGVTWGFRDRRELEEYHADAIIDQPKDLISILFYV